jgi:hypothetical protein
VAISADDRYRLHKGCVHDEIVQIALSGFLRAHFDSLGVSIDREIFDMAIRAFSIAMSRPEIITEAADMVAKMRAAERGKMN